jgi:hypothetical protein
MKINLSIIFLEVVMRNATFMYVCCFFCVIFLSVITQAQNSLTHNTGSLEVTIIDNGYIGENSSGSYGGVVFNGNTNALFAGGFIFGQNGEGGGNYYFILVDFFNVVPITGFFSDPNFNEITYHTVALTGNPDSRTTVKSLSNTGHDFVFIRGGVSNNTTTIDDLYIGIFADWDINNAATNRGGYDPSRNLFYMYDNGGGTDGSYYGIMGIAIDGVPMASNTMLGTIPDLAGAPGIDSLRIYIYNNMTSTAFDTITADGDYRMFIGAGPFTIPVGSSLEVDLAIVAGTSLADLLDNADAAIVYGPFVPVELTYFTATSQTGKVYLNWTTATELNNLGFEVERKILNNQNEGEWIRIGFVEGHGTTTETKEYSYLDDINTIQASSLVYRLKQIDFLGSYEYSDEVYVESLAPTDFVLDQNYPNPFNPSTTITFGVPVRARVSLKVFNSLGEVVAVLINEEKAAGSYDAEFDASTLPSGTYFYRLQAGSFVGTKKMVLMK